jgi:hypothetical protein
MRVDNQRGDVSSLSSGMRRFGEPKIISHSSVLSGKDTGLVHSVQEAVGGSAVGQSHLWTTLALIRVFEIGAPLHAIEVFCLEVPAPNKTRLSFLLPERVGDVTLTGHTTDLSASRAGNNTQLAFWSDRTGREEIYVVPATGGKARRLTLEAGGRPLWSRDGKFIAYST